MTHQTFRPLPPLTTFRHFHTSTLPRFDTSTLRHSNFLHFEHFDNHSILRDEQQGGKVNDNASKLRNFDNSLVLGEERQGGMVDDNASTL